MAATTNKTNTKKHSAIEPDDPNAVHDIYTEENLDPAYDENIADDIAFDYEGRSGDPGDKQVKTKKNK